MAEEKKEIIKIPEYQMETRNLTLSKYDYSEVQQNVITLIQEQLKEYMTKDATEAVVRIDSMGEPYITIDCNEASKKNRKEYVIAEIQKMFLKPISFRWRHESWGKDIKTICPIVTAIHDVKNTSLVKVNYNRWAIPFLIWYGKGIGGTVYDKTVSLTLVGKYTKRIYKLICSYRDKNTYEYDLEKFREDFAIPKSYKNDKIRTNILDKAKEDIDNSKSDVKFDYEMKMVKEGKKKAAAKAIIFKIQWKKTRENMNEQESKVYSNAYIKVGRLGIEASKTVALTDLLMDKNLLQLVIEKYNYYDDLITSGARMQNGQHYTFSILKNVMRKLIREELEKQAVDPRQISYLYPKNEK
jgi:hypothetical protein